MATDVAGNEVCRVPLETSSHVRALATPPGGHGNVALVTVHGRLLEPVEGGRHIREIRLNQIQTTTCRLHLTLTSQSGNSRRGTTERGSSNNRSVMVAANAEISSKPSGIAVVAKLTSSRNTTRSNKSTVAAKKIGSTGEAAPRSQPAGSAPS